MKQPLARFRMRMLWEYCLAWRGLAPIPRRGTAPLPFRQLDSTATQRVPAQTTCALREPFGASPALVVCRNRKLKRFRTPPPGVGSAACTSSAFEMRRTVPANLARSRGTCRVKARCSGRCAGCSCGRDSAVRLGYRARRLQAYSRTHAAACEDAVGKASWRPCRASG
jgi:hypothetical protein